MALNSSMRSLRSDSLPVLMEITDTEALSYVTHLLEQLIDSDQELVPNNNIQDAERRPSYEQAVEWNKEVLRPLIPNRNYTTNSTAVYNEEDEHQQAYELYKRFWLKEVPPISVKDYLLRFHRYCKSSAATYLTAGCLIHLVAVELQAIPITQRNVYRIFCAAFIVSAKYMEDELYSMTRYATTAGIKVPDLARLEVSFLLLIDFNVKADRETLKQGLRNWALLNEGSIGKFTLGSNIVSEFGLSKERLCNPSGGSSRFSGLRTYSSMVYDWPVRHYWVVTHCNAGEVIAMQFFPCSRSSNFMFATPLELDNGETYIFSRKKKYSTRRVPIYRPLASIGAVYQLHKANNTTKLLAPLLADNPATTFSLDSPIGHKFTYVPLFYAPFDLNTRSWEFGLAVSPYELYDYSEKDRSSTWYRISSLLNNVDEHTYINDRIVFWEFDSLDSQINGTDWRKLVNAVVPDV